MSYLIGLLRLLTSTNRGSVTLLMNELTFDMTILIFLTVVTGVMAGAILIAFPYAVFMTLVYYGLSGQIAMLIAILLAFAEVGGVLYTMLLYSRRLREVPTQMLESEEPIISRISGIGTEFMKGFMVHSSHK